MSGLADKNANAILRMVALHTAWEPVVRVDAIGE